MFSVKDYIQRGKRFNTLWNDSGKVSSIEQPICCYNPEKANDVMKSVFVLHNYAQKKRSSSL